MYPPSPNNGPDVVGGWLNFFAQPFELFVDKRSAMTSGAQNSTHGVNQDHGNVMKVHNIVLPYVNSVSNETSTWDTGNQETLWNRTDADTGIADWWRDWWDDMREWVDWTQKQNVTNMEVSNAGYKGPVLRQRHYTWTLINRSGEAYEGRIIASICRKFQASVYPKMSPTRTADNIIFPPPMWTIQYMPNTDARKKKSYITRGQPGSPGTTPNVGDSFNQFDSSGGSPLAGAGGQRDRHPSVNMAGHNAWRWNMDPLTSVLVNVSISPTSATDAIQVPTSSGWPLVTILKCSFLEVDQALAGGFWEFILPYSWATDEDNKFFGGFQGGGISPL